MSAEFLTAAPYLHITGERTDMPLNLVVDAVAGGIEKSCLDKLQEAAEQYKLYLEIKQIADLAALASKANGDPAVIDEAQPMDLVIDPQVRVNALLG